MEEGLTPDQVAALAELFVEPAPARYLLIEAGIPVSRMLWAPFVPRNFWTEVDLQLRAGIVAGGSARLVAAARSWYPANPLFGGVPALPRHDDTRRSAHEGPPRLALASRDAGLAGQMTVGAAEAGYTALHLVGISDGRIWHTVRRPTFDWDPWEEVTAPTAAGQVPGLFHVCDLTG
jgi:hypothetical protein